VITANDADGSGCPISPERSSFPGLRGGRRADPETAREGDVVRRVVTLDGRRVSFLTAGPSTASSAILLIHGSGVSAASWVDQLGGLSHASRVVAIDLPGHGDSDPIAKARVEVYAEVAASLVGALGVRSVVVTGHSLGGAVAIALAARLPGTVCGLVLLSSCARLPRVDASWERLLACLPGGLRKILFFATAKKILLAPGASGRATSLAMRELRACRPETILKDLHAAKTMDLTADAARLSVPTLILCGSRDRLTPPAFSQTLKELIPGASLRIIDRVGHMLPLEAPERVNREILVFAGALGSRAHRPSLAVVPAGAGSSFLRRLRDWAWGTA
jgi:pimeloyl-ACP methyl ester carboxylesterase